jgi:hypothetical protein
MLERSVAQQMGAKETARWAIVNDFNEAYYSGLDVSVYLGGIYVEEISQFQYQEMEQVRPIYSYASYTPTIITHGTRMTQGSFTLNFKDANYLKVLLEIINTKANATFLDAAFAHAYQSIPRANVESTLIQAQSPKETTIAQATFASLSTDQTLVDIINMKKQATGESYTDLMTNLSTRYWNKVSKTQASLTNADNTTKYAPKGLSEGFDITIKYGQPDDPEGFGSIRLIRDCHISGFSSLIDDSGRNIAETYTFLASSVD